MERGSIFFLVSLPSIPTHTALRPQYHIPLWLFNKLFNLFIQKSMKYFHAPSIVRSPRNKAWDKNFYVISWIANIRRKWWGSWSDRTEHSENSACSGEEVVFIGPHMSFSCEHHTAQQLEQGQWLRRRSYTTWMHMPVPSWCIWAKGGHAWKTVLSNGWKPGFYITSKHLCTHYDLVTQN